jgi:hypothetical protein
MDLRTCVPVVEKRKVKNNVDVKKMQCTQDRKL